LERVDTTVDWRERKRAPGSDDAAAVMKQDSCALARLLDEWMRGDEVEQSETFEFLRLALDEDRPAGYKLFA
jgi:hypothetical protein